MAHDHHMKFKYQCPKIKLYKNAALLTHLHSFYGSFHTTMAELNLSQRPHGLQSLKYFLPGLLWKGLSTLS